MPSVIPALPVWKATILTLFPELFPGPLGISIFGRAARAGLWSLEAVNLRDFAPDKHRTVDGPPVGGGAGMVLRPDIMGKALESLQAGDRRLSGAGREKAVRKLIYPSPRGKPFTQARAAELAQAPGLVFICGRFEGLDQRVIDHFGIEEISLGDFVLAGGEVATMAMLEAILRNVPGVLGSAASLEEESFHKGLLEYPQYTRPMEWQGREVPPVLRSGHHGQIRQWRREQAEELTRLRRPDLWKRYYSGEE